MRKNYQILLCESFYENETFIEKPVCEVGSSTSTFSGQAFNVEFYTKIDGTHELTFNLPRYYYDEYTGKRIKNDLVELIVNKSRLELTRTSRDGEPKTFYMVVNSRKDKEEKGVFSYEYSCGDAYIEELGKNGYGVVFDDDVEGNGLGDIHHFARVIEKSSGWEYDEEKTGLLREYTTDMKWNVAQNRYDEVKTLAPVNEIEYIPELERYCYKMSVYKKELHRVLADGELLPYMHQLYCYDDSRTITNSAIKNMLYNGDDFTDTVGWQTYKEIWEDKKWKRNDPNGIIESIKVTEEKTNDSGVKENVDYYYMKISKASSYPFLLLNDTCADANHAIIADKPYVFHFSAANMRVSKIKIYGKNPLTNHSIAPDYIIEASEIIPEPDSNNEYFLGDNYYVIKTNTGIATPYFVFETRSISGDEIIIKNIEFFEAQGETEESNLELLKTFYNGKLLSKDKDIPFIQPDSSTFKSYTEQKIQYFIRDNYAYFSDKTNDYTKGWFEDFGLEEKTVTYLNFDEEINAEQEAIKGNASIFTYNQTTNEFDIYNAQKDILEIEVLNDAPEKELEDPQSQLNQTNVSKIYKQKSTGKYYQYYRLPAEPGFEQGGAWDYALLGDGKNGKRRTYKISKSNHFNIIQDIAELFKVWPVFETTKDEAGVVKRKFYFREEALKENFSGFHRGVNLVDLTRTMNSDSVVTKIYVEDQENQHANDGFVTIRTSKFNPWGENYYYNFQYYVGQKLINVMDGSEPLVDKELKTLYSTVRGMNEEIRKLNYENVDLEVEIKDLKNRQKVLSVYFATAQERIASLQAEQAKNDDVKNEYKLGPEDLETLKTNLSNYQEKLDKWDKELQDLDKNLNGYDEFNNKGEFVQHIDGIQDKYDKNAERINKLQNNPSDKREEWGKVQFIKEFEDKYRPYIKEGVWSDSSYIENDAYFIDSQKVMNTSSKPQLEWTINVIDGSFATELENFEFEVGDKTILVDNEFFGVEKNGEENYVFEVLISGVKEGLDDATKNTIEVRNYNTSFEELFERISAATQTLELNEQTYNKSAYFTSDGELSADILQKTLLQNSLILANASDNSYVLDETGLSFQSILNPKKKVRLLAEGLFLSNSTNLSTGAPEWKTGVTAEGISASLLTAGEINTANIKIFSDAQPSQSWNKLGITSYGIDSNTGKVLANTFVRLDQFGLYLVQNSSENVNWHLDAAGKAWFEGLPRKDAISQIKEHSTVSITEDGFVFNYTPEIDETGSKGRLILGDLGGSFGLLIGNKDLSETYVRLDNEGNNEIAGWKINKNSLTKQSNIIVSDGTSAGLEFNLYSELTNNTASSTAISLGVKATKGNTSQSYSTFKVQYDGNVYCNDINVGGRIRLGWNSTQNYISVSDTKLQIATIDNLSVSNLTINGTVTGLPTIDSVKSADYAKKAGYADTAGSANSATTAGTAASAAKAETATTAGTATSAISSMTATTAYNLLYSANGCGISTGTNTSSTSVGSINPCFIFTDTNSPVKCALEVAYTVNNTYELRLGIQDNPNSTHYTYTTIGSSPAYKS